MVKLLLPSLLLLAALLLCMLLLPLSRPPCQLFVTPCNSSLWFLPDPELLNIATLNNSNNPNKQPF